MSYMRGEYYIYEEIWPDDTTRLRFFIPDGSFTIPMEVFDQLTVMRYAELEAEGTLDGVKREVMEKWSGNLGADAVRREHGLPGALDELALFADRIKAERDAKQAEN